MEESKPFAFASGGKYYNVDWESGRLVLSERQENGELFLSPGSASNYFLVEGHNWEDLTISELPAPTTWDIKPGCTCGMAAVGGSVHSSWCDVAEVSQ